ncbi:hypothetical protein, partial [Streptomyces hyderabadensis]|uniref:hypothetical protein n=1 Tax=Streptomyces hyderabadensis TaxID=598549 RepID=UPI00355838E4
VQGRCDVIGCCGDGALIISAVPASETGAANGLNTLMRSIGTSVSSAVIGLRRGGIGPRHRRVRATARRTSTRCSAGGGSRGRGAGAPAGRPPGP